MTHELDAPPAPDLIDLPDLLAAARAALSAATSRRSEIETAIRQAESIPDLARLREQWDEVIHQQEAAHHRQRELLELLAVMPS